MRLNLQPTDIYQDVNGNRVWIWDGKTDDGAAVRVRIQSIECEVDLAALEPQMELIHPPRRLIPPPSNN